LVKEKSDLLEPHDHFPNIFVILVDCGKIKSRQFISPYLFLLYAEGLPSIFLHEEKVSGIDGIMVYKNALSVSHLLFADDSLILIKVDMTNATFLQQVFNFFCANSG
jgi:hypothetical protein